MTTTDDVAQKVWRYMNFARFVWLLQHKQLWMSRIDLLGDPWELTLAGEQLNRAIRMHPITPVGEAPREDAVSRAGRIVKDWRRRTFVSCWSASDHESHALWRIYCRSAEGVALQTTMGRLRQSIGGLPVHRVTYCEPGSLGETPTLTQLATQKRLMFAYEQEVRVLLKARDEDHLAVPAQDIIGQGLEWDPEATLENIWVHPDADFSFMQAVVGVVEHYASALKSKVPWSAMQASPPF